MALIPLPPSPSPDACAVHAFAVTPSDASTYAQPTRWLWVGTTGNVAVTMQDGSTATFNAVPAGYRLPVSVTQVRSTNTTASGIIGAY